MAATNITEKDKEAIAAMEAQSAATTLPSGTAIDPTKQTVEADELMTTANKVVSDPTGVVQPAPITTIDQTTPETITARTYQAQDAAPQLGTATAAKSTEEARQRATVEAAQGQISPESMATAATQQLDPRATTKYQLEELFQGIDEGSPPPA